MEDGFAQYRIRQHLPVESCAELGIAKHVALAFQRQARFKWEMHPKRAAITPIQEIHPHHWNAYRHIRIQA